MSDETKPASAPAAPAEKPFDAEAALQHAIELLHDGPTPDELEEAVNLLAKVKPHVNVTAAAAAKKS